MKKEINLKFTELESISFGDYLLFQEYVYIGSKNCYEISNPILAIYLGSFVADQALGFNYVIWNNDRHIERITNKYVTNFRVCKQVDGIHEHIEWNDYVDILGHWEVRPKWKEIIKAYRTQNEAKHSV